MRRSFALTARRSIIILVSLIIGLVVASFGYWVFRNHDPTYLYNTFMGTPPPADIHDLRGSGRLEVPILGSSTAHLTYQVGSTYIPWLLQSTSGLSGDGFHSVACTDVPQRFADVAHTAAEHPIGKTCITGMHFIYAHFLIYDPTTQQVDHFVIGLHQ